MQKTVQPFCNASDLKKIYILKKCISLADVWSNAFMICSRWTSVHIYIIVHQSPRFMYFVRSHLCIVYFPFPFDFEWIFFCFITERFCNFTRIAKFASKNVLKICLSIPMCLMSTYLYVPDFRYVWICLLYYHLLDTYFIWPHLSQCRLPPQ